jgi:hypothetical protein
MLAEIAIVPAGYGTVGSKPMLRTTELTVLAEIADCKNRVEVHVK